jgi:predicted dehydrogenase
VVACNDFRELLARADIDVVLLALPYHWAAPMSIMAMRQGKDVYCEKPVAVTVQEAQVMRETARRCGRVYQAGTQQRSAYGGKFRRACELVRNGYIGELREVYAFRPPGAYFPDRWTSDQSQPMMDGLDWDMWLGPLPWRPFNGWIGHALPGTYAGDINWGPHHYDFVTWVVDPDPAAPVEIEVEGGVVRYHFSNGVVVHGCPHPQEKVGGEGGACFVGTKGRLAVDRNALVCDPPEIARSRLEPGDRRVYHSTNHADNFLECIRSRRQPVCGPDEAARSMNVLLSGGIALALGRSLRWDPARREFPGDAEANRHLAYRPRPPWHL